MDATAIYHIIHKQYYNMLLADLADRSDIIALSTVTNKLITHVDHHYKHFKSRYEIIIESINANGKFNIELDITPA